MYWTWSTGTVTKSVWYRAVSGRALELAVVVDRRVGRREVGLALLVGPHPDDLVGRLAVLDLAVRRDEEAVLVDAAVDAQRADQADVRPFRGLDRADPAVVRDVDVADLEAGPLAVQAAGPRAESRRSWVSWASGLVWSTTCESSPRPKKYSIAALMLLGLISDRGRHVLGVLEAHPLLDGAAELEEALAQLVGGQLVDRPQPAVAQVVDVVDVALAACAG